MNNTSANADPAMANLKADLDNMMAHIKDMSPARKAAIQANKKKIEKARLMLSKPSASSSSRPPPEAHELLPPVAEKRHQETTSIATEQSLQSTTVPYTSAVDKEVAMNDVAEPSPELDMSMDIDESTSNAPNECFLPTNPPTKTEDSLEQYPNTIQHRLQDEFVDHMSSIHYTIDPSFEDLRNYDFGLPVEDPSASGTIPDPRSAEVVGKIEDSVSITAILGQDSVMDTESSTLPTTSADLKDLRVSETILDQEPVTTTISSIPATTSGNVEEPRNSRTIMHDAATNTMSSETPTTSFNLENRVGEKDPGIDFYSRKAQTSGKAYVEQLRVNQNLQDVLEAKRGWEKDYMAASDETIGRLKTELEAAKKALAAVPIKQDTSEMRKDTRVRRWRHVPHAGNSTILRQRRTITRSHKKIKTLHHQISLWKKKMAVADQNVQNMAEERDAARKDYSRVWRAKYDWSIAATDAQNFDPSHPLYDGARASIRRRCYTSLPPGVEGNIEHMARNSIGTQLEESPVSETSNLVKAPNVSVSTRTESSEPEPPDVVEFVDAQESIQEEGSGIRAGKAPYDDLGGSEIYQADLPVEESKYEHFEADSTTKSVSNPAQIKVINVHSPYQRPLLRSPKDTACSRSIFWTILKYAMVFMLGVGICYSGTHGTHTRLTSTLNAWKSPEPSIKDNMNAVFPVKDTKHLLNTCSKDDDGISNFPNVPEWIPECHITDEPSPSPSHESNDWEPIHDATSSYKDKLRRLYTKVSSIGPVENSNTTTMLRARLAVISTAWLAEFTTPIDRNDPDATTWRAIIYSAIGIAVLGELR